MPRKKKEILDEIERRINADELLSDTERAEILARAQDHVRDLRKKDATDRLFKAAVREEERAYQPDDELVDFPIDLPEYTPMIKIDNVGFFHGIIYEIPSKVAASLRDIQWQAWAHDREIHGRRRHVDMARDPYNRGVNTMRDTRMSMTTGQVTTREL